MKITGNSLFARLIHGPTAILCLALTLFYAASMGLYLNSAFAAQPLAAMEDCHGMDMSHNQQPDNTSCCSTVGCCPMLTPLNFVPIGQQFAQPLQLAEWATGFADLQLINRLDRPPRA